MGYTITSEDLSTHLLLFADKFVDLVHREITNGKYKPIDYCCKVKIVLYTFLIEISGCYDVRELQDGELEENFNCLTENEQTKLIDKISDLLNTFNFPNSGAFE